VKAGTVVHVDRRRTPEYPGAFDACRLSRPEIADTWCLPTGFGDETRVKCYDMVFIALLLHQPTAEDHKIEGLFELDTVALFAIFAVPFQLQEEIDAALIERNRGMASTMKQCLHALIFFKFDNSLIISCLYML